MRKREDDQQHERNEEDDNSSRRVPVHADAAALFVATNASAVTLAPSHQTATGGRAGESFYQKEPRRSGEGLGDRKATECVTSDPKRLSLAKITACKS